MENRDSKCKLGQKVDRPLGWGIMGSILIVVFTLGLVAACLAAENSKGVTAVIVIGAIALAALILYVVCYYVKNGKKKEEAIAPATDEVAPQTPVEVAPVAAPAEEVVAAEEEVAENVAAEESAAAEVAAAEEVAAEAIEEAVEEEEVQEEVAPVEETQPEEAIPAEPVEETLAAVEEPVPEEPAGPTITVEEARVSMSDDEALALIEVRSSNRVDGPMCTVNVGILSATFANGDEVTLQALQAKGIVPRKQNGYIVLAQGTINKALTVVANDFSADAVKMIVAAGGKAVGC